MRIGIYSTVFAPWGGSEELWSQAALALRAAGHEVAVSYAWHERPPARLVELQQAGAEVALQRRRIGRTLMRRLRRWGWELDPHIRWLRRTRSDLLLISVAHHIDDFSHMTREAQRLGVPYAVLVQAAGPYHWTVPKQYETLREAYAQAQHCFFVSAENRATVEANLSLELPRTTVVDNPFNVSIEAAPAWPDEAEGLRLACVARWDYLSKGQDLILRVLRQPKWRGRRLTVTFWGSDNGSQRRMEDYIALHDLHSQARFGGFADDIERLWAEHHGLVLTSRYEGNPLAMIEAMLCGRMAIVTNVGRAAELIDDNCTGFLAAAPTVEFVDDALERAWARRDQWQAIGRRAAAALRERHSLQPAADFAQALLNAANSAAGSERRSAA